MYVICYRVSNCRLPSHNNGSVTTSWITPAAAAAAVQQAAAAVILTRRASCWVPLLHHQHLSGVVTLLVLRTACHASWLQTFRPPCCIQCCSTLQFACSCFTLNLTLNLTISRRLNGFQCRTDHWRYCCCYRCIFVEALLSAGCATTALARAPTVLRVMVAVLLHKSFCLPFPCSTHNHHPTSDCLRRIDLLASLLLLSLQICRSSSFSRPCHHCPGSSACPLCYKWWWQCCCPCESV